MTNDNDPPSPIWPPPGFQLHPDFGNPPQLFNLRDWLQAAFEAKGAEMVGGGIGMGEADIDIELEGYLFNVRIKPILRKEQT